LKFSAIDSRMATFGMECAALYRLGSANSDVSVTSPLASASLRFCRGTTW